MFSISSVDQKLSKSRYETAVFCNVRTGGHLECEVLSGLPIANGFGKLTPHKIFSAKGIREQNFD